MGKNKNMTAKQVYAYLASKGIPKPTMHVIRDVLADEAIKEADNIRYNRIYTALAITLHRHLGFGRKRTMDTMHYFDDLCGEMLNTDKNWGDLMKELDEELHIVIRCGDPEENPLHEYESELEKEEEDGKAD